MAIYTDGDNYPRLTLDFYTQQDVVKIAQQLIGKLLVSSAGGKFTSGIITETEAYNGVVDKASHAFGNRRTKRTETMYQRGGIAYIYLCYGIHSLLNVVTNNSGTPHAVLIRAIYPFHGLDTMSERVGHKINQKDGIGPGKVTKLLGLTYDDDKSDLISGNKVWIEDAGINITTDKIKITPRIGVTYAKEDALLPYRFVANLSAADLGKE
jgi:DNA-3-methyladenine glycosylase